MDGAADVQAADIHMDGGRQVGRQALDADVAHEVVEHPAVFHADGFAEFFDDDFGMDGLVGVDLVQVHVEDLVFDRVLLDFFDQGQVLLGRGLAADFKIDQHVFRVGGIEGADKFDGGEFQSLGFPVAVEHGGDFAVAAGFLDRGGAESGAALSFELDAMCHDVPFSGWMELVRKQEFHRRVNAFSRVFSFDRPRPAGNDARRMASLPPPPAPAPVRRAGVFVPAFALRRDGDTGCGDTLAVRQMADWCARHGFGVLQLLPIHETSGDNSPYNAISSCALDITTLAAEPAHVPGLSQEAVDLALTPAFRRSLQSGPVPYRQVKALKWHLCREAFAGFCTPGAVAPALLKAFDNFRADEESWLFPYALFRALMAEQDDSPVWEDWPRHLRTLKGAIAWMNKLGPERRAHFEVEIRFYQFVQWVLHRQWEDTAAHAAANGVALMGDIPFGLSRSSADVWAQPEQFDLQWSGGAPPEPLFQPDEFTKRWGQNWGVPLYRWEIMEHDGFAWWRRRVRQTTRIFKIFRIDHVLGFYRVFAFPWPPRDNTRYAALSREEVQALAGDLPRFLPHDDETPESRTANQAGGERLLRILQEASGQAVIAAEDLGVVPPYVRPSLLALGISGFKIPMFERDEATREYLPPAAYPELTLSTLSTHDHETMRGLWDRLWAAIAADLGPGAIPRGDEGLGEAGKQAAWELYRLQRFARLDDRALLPDYEPAVREALLRTLWETPSWLAIAMITDLFGLDLRFNVPGPVSESNWSERLPFTLEELLEGTWQPAVQQALRPALLAAARCGG